MTTLVHKVVGEERIKEICRQQGLPDDDIKIIDQILEEWKFLIGKTDEKMVSFLKATNGNPRRGQIMRALFLINAEFAIKQMNPDPNC